MQPQQFDTIVRYGDLSQEILCALGSPNRVFYKAEDKMRIHLPQSQRSLPSRYADYIFNYFTMGLVSQIDFFYCLNFD